LEQGRHSKPVKPGQFRSEHKLEDIIRDLKKYSSYRLLKEIKENSEESRREGMLYLFAKAGQSNHAAKQAM
jgi:hypothetical protein